MNIDLHALLTAFPALQSSPFLLGLFNAGLIIYHILTHNKNPKPSGTIKSRPANKSFVPDELYTPWSDAWFEQQNKQMKEYMKGKVLTNLVSFKADLQHARVDLKNLLTSYPAHPKSDDVRERIFKIEQILRAFDKAGRISPTA